MAKYAVELNRTASTTLEVGSVTVDAVTPRRFKIYDMVLGAEATPADTVYLWQVQRCTTQGTATGVTPTALDPADAAALFDAAENHTINGTLTAGQILLSIPLNQRATFRWVAAPGGELIAPATASNGMGLLTPTATGLTAITALLHVDEQ